MKIVRNIVVILSTIVVLVLVIAFFMPAQYQIERSVTINSPVESVYRQVIDYQKWKAWAPWPKMDPEAQYSYQGTMGTTGAKWSWKGEVLGTGSLTLETFEPYRSIHSKLVFEEPQAMESDDIWEFEAVQNGTKATWITKGELDYPLGRLFGPFIESMLAPDIESGLEGLKTQVESIAAQ